MGPSLELENSPKDVSATLRVQTLGGFRVWRENLEIPISAWKREKALHLFQFLITTRLQESRLHKEQIIDHLWPEVDAEGGDRDFKVALHAVNKVLEPDRKPRTEPHFIQRHDLTYDLNLQTVWIDAIVFEELIMQGNQQLSTDRQSAIELYQQALSLYHGDYLPERRYEDWSSAERERLQVLALGLMTTLAGLLLDNSPLECIRLTQRALTIDPIWEDAYRMQMRAYWAQGNRPVAIRTYQQCVKILNDELGIEPLPETVALYNQIVKP
jgi:DNA-binding SARP family transcriptional activator